MLCWWVCWQRGWYCRLGSQAVQGHCSGSLAIQGQGLCSTVGKGCSLGSPPEQVCGMGFALAGLSDQTSWWDETGAYAQQLSGAENLFSYPQQLGGASNLLPCLVGLQKGLHGQYSLLAGSPNEAELPTEIDPTCLCLSLAQPSRKPESKNAALRLSLHETEQGEKDRKSYPFDLFSNYLFNINLSFLNNFKLLVLFILHPPEDLVQNMTQSSKISIMDSQAKTYVKERPINQTLPYGA